MHSISDYFGSLVFDARVMKATLSAEVYKSLTATIAGGAPLETGVADAVAGAMKDWAIAHGATHYTHWFQPLTGITAEKHDSFISPAPDGGVIMAFSGKQLLRGEPDASSFPSGGLRATFEARGYTAWDPTSYAFIKDRTLCIPTAFCSYGGEALDQKTPLLRSMQTLNLQALRILRLFGCTDVQHVTPTVGAEQEYFLIPRQLYEQRMDLRLTGRTLFGARAPKDQQLGAHYFGALSPQVSAFMASLDRHLWQLGIPAKTEHNEVAPSQFELAPIHTSANVASDHNQLTMELMQKCAAAHGLVCLLHEKPFAGVSGSGKHSNWSLLTDTGVNLLSPGKTPHENARFLLLLCAVVESVDRYQDLLRCCTAGAGNDCRLGGDEAPPAIVSVYLGQELTAIFESIADGTPYEQPGSRTLRLGVDVLPPLPRDTTDRNRTSPFAFTGNKFEFRMLGSSSSIAMANTVLNTAVADVLREYADTLSQAPELTPALQELLRSRIRAHRRILFGGNGYDPSWPAEAEARGLAHYPSTADCLPQLLSGKNVRLLSSHGVLSASELQSRYDIASQQYCATVIAEARTMAAITQRQLLPAVSGYCGRLARTLRLKGGAGVCCGYEQTLLAQLSELADSMAHHACALREALATPEKLSAPEAVRSALLPTMALLRSAADEAETLMPERDWPLVPYSCLLFSV